MSRDRDIEGGTATGLLDEESEERAREQHVGQAGSSAIRPAAPSPGSETRPAADALVGRIDFESSPFRARESKARVKDTRRHSLLTLAAVLLVLAFVALTAMNISGSGPFVRGASGVSETQRERMIAGDVMFAGGLIEAKIEESGELPADLSDFEFAAEPGWSYSRIREDAFVLELSDEGYRALYDSRLGPEGLRVHKLR